jgi:hypothetical protein
MELDSLTVYLITKGGINREAWVNQNPSVREE